MAAPLARGKSVLRRQLLLAAAGAALTGGAALAQAPSSTAADFPNKPIRLVVTFPPGGSADAVMRMLVPRLNEKLGQPVVIDNKPGAGGNVGLSLVAKTPADGYTLGLGAAGALAANVSLYPQMPFDPVKDFKPVAMVAATPFVIVGHPSIAARTQRELIALAKANPGTLSIGHGGNGTAMHLSAALFAQMADVKLVEVPYRGSGPAALDAIAGQIPLALVDLPASLQQIRAGKLVAFAVTSAQRVPMLPEVPTVAEAGLPGYDSTGWFGVVAPAGTPAPVVARLNAEINAALGDEQIKASMRNLGAEPAPASTEAFEAYIQSETKKWAKVIQAARIRLD
ncbi:MULTISPECIES: tripartite tricarboxylate transporter substrate binding protein [unclassified Variovorax]|jgi:tripartite-type tricarboxylate transporter receptor subunit TctC|uniref:Bug family tripartite tricarboxylate transporter substrate binding protein n=1 Tax=unclassified Variovorax TaxID=663243 RepID=UPI000F7DDA14|nr:MULTISPECIES: tripartite tricarboxylate transporter substrate binding protein [unclassified Variovorax]RSZ42660.1 tripartite tricarboxylate transporter substrate binding protein [Variovorax sp. 553]RSZ43634.1 tripartite tricarboxylate transporter substrate binding protein [Variovorax sp. 679]